MNAHRGSYFATERSTLDDIFPARISGRITRIVGLIAESHGLAAPVGAQCEIVDRRGGRLAAEVVGFREESTIVIPYGDIRGIAAGDRIYYTGDVPRVWVGGDLVGRVLDSAGAPIDGSFFGGRLQRGQLTEGPGRQMPIHGSPINPMLRQRIERPLSTGIRVIDGLFTVGQGQRMGIFAGSGVGKSILLSMIARNTAADISVIGLIGERGREVREFVERELGPEGLEKTIVVVATSDEPALRRLRAALVATAIAEYYRDQGLEVMLMLDSITRVAMAQREIGLSAGEPPATRGYPPSVFAMLPKLLERSGPGVRGSITAFYTVLVEGDDVHDTIGDAVRGILDGHLWLSRDLAGRSFFPAVDPLLSISRSMPDVVEEAHLRASQHVTSMLSRYRGAEDLIQLGAYTPGADAAVDEAVRAMPGITEFLKQDRKEVSDYSRTVSELIACAGSGKARRGRATSGAAALATPHPARGPAENRGERSEHR